MPIPPLRRLPERPSLEQLRKQAKEHLDTLRAADPSATLSAAQHALAREYGFDSWPALVRHVESLQPQRRMLQPAELKSDQPSHVVIRPRHGRVGAVPGLRLGRSPDGAGADRERPLTGACALRLPQAALFRRARKPR